MIDKLLASSVLTVGCSYHHPKGGIAQVMNSYERFVFPIFKTIVNSGGSNKLIRLWKALFGLFKMSVKLAIDKRIKIVHIHTASYNSFRRSAWYITLAKLFRKRVILHIHGGGFKKYYVKDPQWISSILNECDALITLSDSWKEYFKTISTKPDVFVVENIVPKPSVKKISKNDNKFHLLYLGLITEEKGIFDLVDVLYEHFDSFKDKLVLHIGGNGKTYKLFELIKDYSLGEVIRYEGFVSGANKETLLSVCDALILPSYAEGLPVSILEAMAYGKPILSTPVGGIPEIVKDNVNGILFQPGDKDVMYNSICKLLIDKTLRINMGDKSLQYIKPFFPDNISKEIESIYQALIGIRVVGT